MLLIFSLQVYGLRGKNPVNGDSLKACKCQAYQRLAEVEFKKTDKVNSSENVSSSGKIIQLRTIHRPNLFHSSKKKNRKSKSENKPSFLKRLFVRDIVRCAVW